MQNQQTARWAFMILIAILGCKPDSKPAEEAFKEELESSLKEKTAVDAEVIGSILQQIPSPLEISVLLKNSGTKYNKGLLNSPGNASKYSTNYKKALNLGIYGTDLGYTNIYEQNMDGIAYLSSIKSLADELNIGQFFDLATIGKLAASSKNLDSLLLITTQNFNAINNYLQAQDRANLSVLLLVGGWLEAMEITCQAAAKNPANQKLQDTIGEQKIIFEQINLLLSFYSSDANIKLLAGEFEQLKQAYDKITINYTYKESTMEIVDGVAIIKDNSTTTIKITQADVDDIKRAISSIRNKTIS